MRQSSEPGSLDVAPGGRPRIIVGVMGGAEVGAAVCRTAHVLGRLIAEQGWVLLTGGRDRGVMRAAAQGAKEVPGSLTLGVLPDRSWRAANPYIDLPVATGLGDARNVVNVLTSRVVFACRGGAGTLSEIALALKNGRPVILVDFEEARAVGPVVGEGAPLHATPTPAAAVSLAARLLAAEPAAP